VTRQWAQYLLDRNVAPAEEAGLSSFHRRFEDARLDMRELIVAVAASQVFRYRVPGAGEP
jgi:hypothetical protein